MSTKRVVLILIVSVSALAVGVGPRLAANSQDLHPAPAPEAQGAAIPYTGRLTDEEGAPVPEGAYAFTFALYAAESGGEPLWSEVQEGVEVTAGALSTTLGAAEPIPPVVLASAPALWLAVGVRGPGESEFTALSPRQALSAEAPAAPASTSNGMACPHDHWGEGWTGLAGDGLNVGRLLSEGAVLATTDGVGVYGWSGTNHGVKGWSTLADASGVYGNSTATSGSGVLGHGTTGVEGIGDSKGVYGEGPARGVEGASDGVAVLGTNLGSGNYAELGRANDAIHAVAWSGKGAWVQAPNSDGVYGESGASNKSGVYGVNSQGGGFGVYGRNSFTGNIGYLGGAYGVYGESASGGAYAAAFKGNVAVLSRATGDLILELGEGLDYAEGFDVSQEQQIRPGTVLVIDPDHPGELAVSERSYDRRVAGIVAGARGLGSGVRLGADRYEYDVALAGRVYCYVDATEAAVEPGDLLTTSARPGYAMKVTDHDRAQGAILGKAMGRLEKGQRGLILVLVTLQ
jgi:hypothetical protein